MQNWNSHASKQHTKFMWNQFNETNRLSNERMLRQNRNTNTKNTVYFSSSPSSKDFNIGTAICIFIIICVVGAFITTLVKGIFSHDPVKKGIFISLAVLLGICVTSCILYLCHLNRNKQNNETFISNEKNTYGTDTQTPSCNV